MNQVEPIQLMIKVNGDSISERRLNEMTIVLKDELTNLKPLSIDLQRDSNVPEDVMSVTAITVGAIALAVLPTAIPALIEFLREWRLRNSNRMITIKRRSGEEEIEVSFPEDMSSKRLHELIDSISNDVVTSELD